MDELRKLLTAIEALFKSEQYKAIIDKLKDAELEKYQNADLYAWRAYAHNKLKESEKAFAYANKAIDIDNTSAFAFRQRGLSWYNQEDYDKAIAEYDRALAINTDDAIAYSNRGLAFNDKGEYDKAIADYDKAIEIKNDYADAYYNRGITWSNLGEYGKAIADYDKEVGLRKEKAYSYNNRGIAWSNLGEYDKAFVDYDNAIKFNRQPELAYNNRAIIWSDKGETEKAISDYDMAIDLKKDDAVVYNNRGITWHEAGNYQKAIDDLNLAIGFKNDYALAYRNRGNVYFAYGDLQNAINDFQKAIDIDKKNFGFLEYNLKLAEEKLLERKNLEASTAKQKDIEERKLIETEIETLINSIKDAARSKFKTVVHYTKVFVAEIYVKNHAPKSQGITDETQDFQLAKMHYSNAIYMNDPMEGKMLFEYFGDERITNAYLNGEKRTETSVYLGSFLPAEDNDGEVAHEDELVMWRTYGKDEKGNEAAGCSIVFDSDFFKKPNKGEQSVKDNMEELLNVIYLKKNKNQKKVMNDEEGSMTGTLIKLKEQLLKFIALRDKNEDYKEFYKDIENSIFKKLSEISYLFKSADYEYEHEARVITYMPRKSNTIKFMDVAEPGKAPPKRFYIESYNDILPYIRKIYLGPKVEHYQQWSLYLDYEIRQRDNELKAMKEKAPYLIKPEEIEIVRSENKFQ